MEVVECLLQHNANKNVERDVSFYCMLPNAVGMI